MSLRPRRTATPSRRLLLVVPPAHAVGDSHKSPLDRTSAASAPLRVATRRHCDNNIAACRCDSAGTAARRADGRSLLAATATATMPPRVASHRDRTDNAARRGTAARRPAALVPPRLRIARRRQTAATIAGRHRARTRRQHHTSPARSSVPRQLRHYTASLRATARRSTPPYRRCSVHVAALLLR